VGVGRSFPCMGMRVLLGGLLTLAVAGCASGMQCGPSSDPQWRNECVATGGPVEAAGTAAAAGAAWAVEGCTVNGCNMPYTCNEDTGYCERLTCGEGESCPSPYECDLVRGRCF